MAKGGKREKDDGSGGPSAEEQASLRESKRLLELAMSRGLLSRFRANPGALLRPSKTIRKCDGKDIVKKGQRKNRYLFAFPGLMAPLSGGKFGELKHLDSRNPTFYIDFPQGRLKLFGTIVYPKNKYLMMHFLPGRGDIVCEDCFESIVVFPEAWWIGTKEENPEELRLKMPSNLQQEEHVKADFTGGAGEAPDSNIAAATPKVAAVKDDLASSPQESPLETHDELPGENTMQYSSLRRSSRTAAEKIDYGLSSADNSDESDDLDDHIADMTMNQTSPKRFEDVIMSQSSISAPVPAASGGKSGLKQATLATFLTKSDSFQDSIVGIATEELSQKTESGGTKVISERSHRVSRKTYQEESDKESTEDEQESSDSDRKGSGSQGRSGRGRGRGRGRGGKSSGSSRG